MKALENVISTIRDVAKLANVYVTTVTRVLNPSLTISEQCASCGGTSYCAVILLTANANAQALAVQNTDTIGVVNDRFDLMHLLPFK